ncbi:MAG: hypothetical protein COB67_07345 [SAR324 cluster bacterium]|uniref:Uncharacterized protein n=1 Tax=SAR324 cluster bacterium TaxID=2024889 RepID=A0A2A4T400_9DELT|nr:MAG: hypothetical protein COB67_07345 [SAR324 cluster bacterium]
MSFAKAFLACLLLLGTGSVSFLPSSFAENYSDSIHMDDLNPYGIEGEIVLEKDTDGAYPDPMEMDDFQPSEVEDEAIEENDFLESLMLTIDTEFRFKEKRVDLLTNPNNQLLDYEQREHTGMIDLEWNPQLGEFLTFRSREILQYRQVDQDDEVNGFLLEGYLQWENEARTWAVDLGKKKIEWSSGFAWSPANVLIPKEETPSNDILEQAGIEMLQLESVWNNITITALAAKLETDNVENGRQYAARSSLNFDPWELALIYHQAQEQSPVAGMSLNGLITDEMELHIEWMLTQERNRKTPGQKSVDQGPSLLQWYDYETADKEQEFYQFLLGGRHTFKNDSNLTLEFLHDSHGYNNQEWEIIKKGIQFSNQALKTKTSDPLEAAHAGFLKNTAEAIKQGVLRQNYLFLRWDSGESSNLWRWQQVVILNLDDSSQLYRSVLSKAWNDYIQSEAAITVFQGGELTEYGLSPYKGIGSISIEISF